MHLFHSLRQTVLPAHWVGVMAKGPILQLLQCSKLSTMADTVIQIEKGFFYQISVQNQPLLLMHSVYMRHPTCLTSVGDVVSLLLDLEGMSVCQGHQNFNLGTPWEPRMCVRAALCDLLIPKDEEQCEKCAHPEEVWETDSFLPQFWRIWRRSKESSISLYVYLKIVTLLL